MDFHPLTLKKLPAAMRLENSIKQSTAWFSADAQYQKNIIEKGLNFGAFEDGELIGKVGFWSELAGEFEVDGMIIDEKFRGKGVGKKLLTYALGQLIKKMHPKNIILFTHPKNTAAIALYSSFGFEKKEFIPNKYGPGYDRVKMEKVL